MCQCQPKHSRASDWCALQEALYKCLDTIQIAIQYKTIQYIFYDTNRTNWKIKNYIYLDITHKDKLTHTGRLQNIPQTLKNCLRTTAGSFSASISSVRSWPHLNQPPSLILAAFFSGRPQSECSSSQSVAVYHANVRRVVGLIRHRFRDSQRGCAMAFHTVNFKRNVIKMYKNTIHYLSSK